jgi:hypothetical protein
LCQDAITKAQYRIGAKCVCLGNGDVSLTNAIKHPGAISEGVNLSALYWYSRFVE